MNPALIVSVFVVASCGLAYELIMAALASYLLGDSILQFSSIIGVYMFAMGIGAHLTRYISDRDALSRFIDIEILVGIVGGVSALLLFVLFGFSAAPFRSVLYGLVLIIGIITGMELPLVMRVLNLREVEFKEVVSRVLTFDYLGALAVSLLFPLILAPKLGMARSALLFGILNTAVALLTARLFKHELPRYQRLRMRGNIVLLVLLLFFCYANHITNKAEQHYFGDPVVFSTASPYQRLVITKWHNDTRLFLNGNLQFSSVDEARYHEALVLPVMEQNPQASRILILGGGDGLAAREVLKYPQVSQITLVDLDASMTRVFRTSAALRELNQNSLNHPKLRIINADAAQWLQHNQEKFDVVIIDFPDPSNFSLGKLYSVPMYRMVARHLNPHGNLVVQSTSPYFAPNAFWCIVNTLEAAGLKTLPFHVYVPSFGEWGYVMANQTGEFLIPDHYRVPTRYLDAETTREMFVFPKDMQRRAVEPNHLNTQKLVEYFEADWRAVMR
ncbi:polyamine aminopropyltransferase [Snodgrassella alvi]|uniref:polyamine aminopropyltransferase n=1 Tax=Snodgrassella TaxID=1193515 RepID=UPI002269996E|nr:MULTISPECIES: polyamine aminopropyltransferase [unclassified Snodgrassella]MCX8749342.1 polyamine aminopropyltransferase [Snodgrassella sp. B3088]MCX8753990.1 polyamine aminopropyltransferase [Snodgrassella sp. B3837]